MAEMEEYASGFSHEREERRILHLMRQTAEMQLQTTQDELQVGPSMTPTPLPNGVRLPILSSLFPSIPSPPSGDSSTSPYPTPVSPATPLSSGGPKQLDLYIVSNIDAIRRGFAFHRQCNRHAFVCYDEAQADALLGQLQNSVVHGQFLTSDKLCGIYSIAAVSALFNRVEISSQWGDLMYQAASERLGDWIHDEPLTGMRCCGLLGLVDLFQKAAISVLYYGKCTS